MEFIVFVGLVAAIYYVFKFFSEYSSMKMENERLNSIARDFDKRENSLAIDRLKFRQEVAECKRKNQAILAQINRQTEKNEIILKTFQESFLDGRKWLCNLVALQWANEDTRHQYLMIKRHTAPKTAQEVKKIIQEEKRALCAENLFLKSKIDTYKEYFPFLDAMEEEILEETIDISTVDENSQYDRTKDYLSKEEFANLTSSQKNQLALDRYFDRASSRGVGMLYELFLGYNYEQQGYKVVYPGVMEGFADKGRDLICIKDTETLIVQAKCWSKLKTVRENVVCQLFGTMCEYRRNHPLENVKGVLCLQNSLSEVGKDFAYALGIEVLENYKLQKGSFPTIKCNIGIDGEKIYHLPFDQQYRTTKIDKPGEFMAFTVAEAESKGFRRAFRNTKIVKFKEYRRSSNKQRGQ